MPNYAIHDDNIVYNVIIAESVELAEELTGMKALETTGQPWISWVKIDGAWREPQPFPSWTWDGDKWVAPVPYPSDGGEYYWSEPEQRWVAVTG